MLIWARARVRAFAHQAAAERTKLAARSGLVLQASVTIGSTALLICGYFATQSHFLQNDGMREILEIGGNGLFLASTLLSIYATFLMLTSDRPNLIKLQSRHEMMVREFMSIAQKVRRSEANVYEKPYYKYLVTFLNDQIETLITAGENPMDEDYAEAHKLFSDVKENPDDDIRQSFVPIQDE